MYSFLLVFSQVIHYPFLHNVQVSIHQILHNINARISITYSNEIIISKLNSDSTEEKERF